MYAKATGWLGWSDRDAMTTPVPRIMIALDGRIDCIRKTNPFGGEDKPKRQSRTQVERGLKAAFEQHPKEGGRGKRR